MKQLRTIFSLSLLNTREWIRLKFFHIIIFFGVLFIAFSHLLSSLTFSVQERLLYDFGLGSLELALMMIAGLIGSHSIHREIERKTMFVLLARPIPRSSIVLGAWGSIFILSVFFLIGFLISLVVSSPHSEVAVEGLLISSVISLQKAMVISSVAIAFGIMVRPLLAFVASLSYWILCYSMQDIEFFVAKLDNPEMLQALQTIKHFFPQFYLFNWKSYYFLKHIPHPSDVMWSSLHNLSWMIIWLLVACVVFRRKEIV